MCLIVQRVMDVLLCVVLYREGDRDLDGQFSLQVVLNARSIVLRYIGFF